MVALRRPDGSSTRRNSYTVGCVNIASSKRWNVFSSIMSWMKMGEHMKFQSVPRKSRWCTAVQQSFSIELVSHLHVRDNEWHHVCISHNFRSYRTHDRYIPQFNQVPNASNEITVAYYTRTCCYQ